jgi:hypothetical protein
MADPIENDFSRSLVASSTHSHLDPRRRPDTTQHRIEQELAVYWYFRELIGTSLSDLG